VQISIRENLNRESRFFSQKSDFYFSKLPPLEGARALGAPQAAAPLTRRLAVIV
jgi:hypothetical protein